MPPYEVTVAVMLTSNSMASCGTCPDNFGPADMPALTGECH